MFWNNTLCYNVFGDEMEIVKFVLGDIRSNCYVVYEKNHAFVIDPGFENDVVIPFIKEKNLILDGIYITHGHFDHVGGVKQLKDAFGVQVYAPKEDLVFMNDGPYNRIGYPIPVDQWVIDGDEVNFLNQIWKVYITPGHSPGSSILYGNHTLFSGDTLFYQSIGRTDIPFADSKTIYHSVKRIYSLFEDDVIIYPGHGRSSTIGHEKLHNPFVRA